MNTKAKLNYKNLIILIISSISFIIFIISIINIIIWQKESNKIENQIKKVQQVVIDASKDNENTEIVETNEDIESSNPYWEYIKMDMINVDLTQLKKENDDVKGWIQVKGTNINYPFVQAPNNEYYLNKSFDKSYNSAGWVFLDYRNNETHNRNTILYAHGRLDKTMFGSLRNILKSGWLNNKSNYIVKISTETENTLWQVFSVYHIPTTSDYIQTEFNSDQEFLRFANMLKDRSSYNFDTNISEIDKILTLSTCYSKTDKVVMHAKLIKRETR